MEAGRLFNLEGTASIVTGAASGMGRAITQGLSSVGASVVAADLPEALRKVKRRILQRKQPCIPIGVDLAKRKERVELVNQALRHMGRIDLLVNCAGFTRSAPSEKYSDHDWQHTMEINLSAVFHLCQLVAKGMIKRRSGTIINIASIGATLGFPNNPAYLASKGGLRQLTRALATDWAQYNIRVNNICPGYIVTPMTRQSFKDPKVRSARADRTMLNRWGNPEELVGPVIFLASQASSYITGSDLFVDGGWAASGLTERHKYSTNDIPRI